MESLKPLSLSIESPYMQRVFQITKQGFITSSFLSLPSQTRLIHCPTDSEGMVTINNTEFSLGREELTSFKYSGHNKSGLEDGGTRLEVAFAAPEPLRKGLTVTLIYEASGAAPVLTKRIRIDNFSSLAVKLDHIRVEAITPDDQREASLIFENDFVRGAMVKESGDVNSPWIEKQTKYVEDLLTVKKALTSFQYPHNLDRWLVSGESFQSFQVYEFAVSNRNEERRGMEYRRATRALMPWTAERFFSCMIAPATNIKELYNGILLAAEVGYEGVILTHGWINGVLTSPIFATYADYHPREDLFPNGWEDVRKLTDYAHTVGLKIAFYNIYVSIWDDMGSKAVADHQWELVWAADDDSMRWGKTLCPGSDWGPQVNFKIEEAVKTGGFDGYLLDGPYYGDVCTNPGHAHQAGGPSQALSWQRQVELYERMYAQGFYSCSAQGFCAFAHGVNRVATSGYEEGEFGSLTTWDQILSTRKGAYEFTKVYRPEQGEYYIPLVPWLGGPSLEPLEEHTREYNAFLANCFGYGFEGTVFQHVPYDGPVSQGIINRWLSFWKKNAEFFKKGDLVHVRKPDGEGLDAVMHVLTADNQMEALLVVYN
ncbi:MAG TPA: hypothetical protein VGE40_13750, partial [Bacilli bacterium]